MIIGLMANELRDPRCGGRGESASVLYDQATLWQPFFHNRLYGMWTARSQMQGRGRGASVQYDQFPFASVWSWLGIRNLEYRFCPTITVTSLYFTTTEYIIYQTPYFIHTLSFCYPVFMKIGLMAYELWHPRCGGRVGGGGGCASVQYGQGPFATLFHDNIPYCIWTVRSKTRGGVGCICAEWSGSFCCPLINY